MELTSEDDALKDDALEVLLVSSVPPTSQNIPSRMYHYVNVWQKPLQYCKVISLQLIKI